MTCTGYENRCFCSVCTDRSNTDDAAKMAVWMNHAEASAAHDRGERIVYTNQRGWHCYAANQ